MLTKFLQKSVVIIVSSSLALICGCSFNNEPQPRLGSYATTTLGTIFLDANNLGRHDYEHALTERDGVAYTCRGGDIDIAHVRIAADYVYYIYNKTRKTLLRDRPELSFNLNTDLSVFHVTFQYPDYWKDASPEVKEKIADEMALELSQYFSYTLSTWHEVLTWFGYKSLWVFPEFPSAFSWEDNYSNLVGARLGAEAIEDTQHDFDTAMTIALKKELEHLGVQSRETAREASQKMKFKWWEGTTFVVFVLMKERNMDLGYVDGMVTPTLIPDVCKDQTPLSYPLPTHNTPAKYGFTMDLVIEPKEFEKDKILKIIHPDGGSKFIRPSTDLSLIMSYISRQAISMGYNTMPPKDKSSPKTIK
jgi:hypothetical protein